MEQEVIREFDIVKDENGQCKLEITNTLQYEPEGYPMHEAALYLAYEKNMRILNNEKLYVAAINGNELIGLYNVSVGNSGETQVYIKEAMTFLLLSGADRCVFYHNHPNDVLENSENDIASLRDIFNALEILGIGYEDDVIIGKSGYYSLDQKKIFEWDDEYFDYLAELEAAGETVSLAL